MVFIPTVHVPVPPASPEARKLADKIVELVRLCQEEDARLGTHDVGIALELARGELLTGNRSRIILVVAVVLLALLLGVAGFLQVSNPSGSSWMLLVVGSVVVAVGLVFIVIKVVGGQRSR